MTIVESAVKRQPGVAVQLATRISPESRKLLNEVLAAENVSIRTVVEDAIFARWSLISKDGGVVARG